MILKLMTIFTPLTLAVAASIDYSISVDVSHLFSPQVTADRQGNLILSGFVRDCSLPAVNAISACGPIWAAKLDATGQKILFATYLGDSSITSTDFSAFPRGVKADRDGNIIMVSGVNKALLPAVNAIQSSVPGRTSLYLFKLASDGSRLIYATYLGGSGSDTPVSLAVDDQGAASVLVSTNSQDFPPTPQALSTSAYGRSALAKLSPDGGALVYSATFPWVFTILPLRVDATGAAVLVSSDATLTLSADGSRLDRAPFPQWARGLYPWILPAAGGGSWITGSVTNGLLPVTPGAMQSISGRPAYLRIEASNAQ